MDANQFVFTEHYYLCGTFFKLIHLVFTVCFFVCSSFFTREHYFWIQVLGLTTTCTALIRHIMNL